MAVTFVNVYHSRRWSYDNIEIIHIKKDYVQIRDAERCCFVILRGNTTENPNAFDYFIVEE